MDRGLSAFPPVDLGSQSLQGNGFQIFSQNTPSSFNAGHPTANYDTSRSMLFNSFPAPYDFNVSGSGFTRASNGTQNVIDQFVTQSDFSSNPVYNDGLPFFNSQISSQINMSSQLQRNRESQNLPRQSNAAQSFQSFPLNGFLPALEFQDLSANRNSSSNHSRILAMFLSDANLNQFFRVYHHAKSCFNKGKCVISSCTEMKYLIHHFLSCSGPCDTCHLFCSLLNNHQSGQSTENIPVRKQLFKNFGTKSSDYDANIPESSSKRSKIRGFNQMSAVVDKFCEPSPSGQLSRYSSSTLVGLSSADVMKPFESSSQGTSISGCDPKFNDSTNHLPKKFTSFESISHTRYQNTSEMINDYHQLSPGEELSGYSLKTAIAGSSREVTKPFKNSSQGRTISGCEVKFDDLSDCLPQKSSPFENIGHTTERANKFYELSPGEQLSGYSCKTVIGESSGEPMKPFENSSQGSPISGHQVKFDYSDAIDEEIAVNSRLVVSLKPCEGHPKVETWESNEIKKQDAEIFRESDLTDCREAKQQVICCNDSERRDKSETSPQPMDCDKKSKFIGEAITAISLVESFSPGQVLVHMKSMKEWVGLGKLKATKNQALENLNDKNSCQLCGMGDIAVESLPLYCIKCSSRIKHKRAYYTMANYDGIKNGGPGRLNLCNPCFKGTHGDSVRYSNGIISKAKLTKRQNDAEVLELWVECGKCKGWQHQICALFNAKRNVGGQARYTCPNCYIEEIESGRLKPLPEGVILGARELPRSKLSDYIEQWLVFRLARERQERADRLQKNIDDVPSAENLTVRVVSSVDKQTEVKQIFCQLFEGKGYPPEFPYKSKAILLFQKIEGVDVCLFAFYVQEYGSSCSKPNERRICLSYLDSVKYFRPDIKCVTGEALRTFVYHEILIGYLDYSKRRGFTSCHIWSCPPLKQEDFILNCHPEIQKTPKLDKLREWYLAMIMKGVKDNIVVENTKLYDFFFTPSEGSQTSLTAASLPYFDGDYWPGYAEEFLDSLQQIEDGKEPEKKGRMAISKRALKASRHSSMNDTLSKDSLLMFKLGEALRPMKDDLIIIHLQHSCSYCSQMIMAGRRWVCNQCKKFQLCDKCHDADQSRGEKARHPGNSTVKHSFHPVDVAEVPVDTDDGDENLQSELFDSRITFLNLCQMNHYQYDTLRRAKHSTMMILYHLHNPSVSAYVVSCFHCHADIAQGQVWHCEKCPEYDICDSCYCERGDSGHHHDLVRERALSQGAVSEAARPKTPDLLELLVHAANCMTSCKSPNCRMMKALFRHGANCKIRMVGGCNSCQKMWYLLKLHAKVCRQGNRCLVPRCRDLKENMRKMETRSDFRCRSAAVEDRKLQLKEEAEAADLDSE